MFWRRKRNPEDLAEEIRSHLALEADELRSDGVSDATSAARRAFGNVTSLQERSYERGRVGWLDDLGRDLRYAWRTLRRSPAYTAGTALLLALGIGANTAIFSFVEAIVLRPLPVPDPHSLMLLKWHSRSDPKIKRSISGEAHRDPLLGYVSGNFPYPALQYLAADHDVLSGAFGFAGGNELTAIAGGVTDRAKTLFVSGAFFGTLQIPPVWGRMLDSQDELPAATPVVVLSHSYWQSRFHGEGGVIGQTILINNAPFVIAGVAPKGFFGVDSSAEMQLYLPLSWYQKLRTNFSGNQNSMYADNHWFWVFCMARLKPGVTVKQAESKLAAVWASWLAGVAANDAERADLPVLYLDDGAPGLDMLRIYYTRPLYAIVVMAALILLIACANVASLQLARAHGRRREIALRYGLGASRWRIARQMLTEGVLLSALGGALSIAFAWIGMRCLSALIDVWRPGIIFRAEIDWNCAVFSAALAVLAGLLFGVGPAIQASRIDLTPALKETRGGSLPSRLQRWIPALGLRSGLVTVQIALSLLLIAGAGLFVRTLSNLRSVSLGFQPEGVFTFDLDGRQGGYKQDALSKFYFDVEARLRDIPGVRSVAAASYALSSGSSSGTTVSLPGNPTAGDIQTAVMWIGPGFFSTLRLPLVAGREFTTHDTASAPMTVVVNEAFVARHLTGNPIGQLVHFASPENKNAVVVGVCGNTPVASPRNPIGPMVFGAYAQHATRVSRMTFLMRSDIDGVSLSRAARSALDSVDRRAASGQFASMSAGIQQTIGQERLLATLSSAFAVLALVIASVGLYGTLAYDVSRRTAEIGIRIAIGAKPRSVVAMILRESAWMIVAGVVLGLPFVWASGKVIQDFLYGAKPSDASSLAVPVVVLLVSALAAAVLPAGHAARIDPTQTLRHE